MKRRFNPTYLSKLVKTASFLGFKYSFLLVFTVLITSFEYSNFLNLKTKPIAVVATFTTTQAGNWSSGSTWSTIIGIETPGNISNSGTWVSPTVAESCAGGSDEEVPAGSGSEDCNHFDNLTCGACSSGIMLPDPPAIVDINRDLCIGESSLITIVTSPLTLYEENFDTNNEGVEGNPNCTNIDPPTSCPDYTPPTNNQWSISGSTYDLTNDNDYLIVSGNRLEGRDIDGTLCFESVVIDIAGIPTIDFSLEISDGGNDMESTDSMEVFYTLDGGTPISAAIFTEDISGSQIVSETGLTGNSFQLTVCFSNDHNNEEYRLDDILVNYTPPAAVTYNFYDVDPVANPGSTAVSSGTSYDPMTTIGNIDTIWVTCFDGTDESNPTMVILSYFCNADLDLIKTIDDTMPMVGETVTYSLVVKNNGPHDATGVAVTDTLPAALTYVMGSIAGPGVFNDSDPNGAGLIWSGISIPLNDSITLTFDAVINTSTIINNTAEVTASDLQDPDSTPDNDIPAEDDQDDVMINPTCTPTGINIQISQN